MVVGARRMDFDPKAKTKFYLKRERQMGKNLITTSTQRTNSSLMVVSQWPVMPRVVAEQQTNTCSQVINA